MNKDKIILGFLMVIGFALCFAGFVSYTNQAIKKHEQAECKRWQEQAKEYLRYGYYLTDWQIDQCNAVGYPITLQEPVPRIDFEGRNIQ